MNSPDVSPGGFPQNAAEAESRSVPTKTTNCIDLVRARHETRIRRILVVWCAETPAGGRSIPTLTQNQQSNLQELLVDMFVELGEARLVDLLTKSPSPEEFESDSEHLIEVVASEARARWNTLTMRYDLNTEAAETTVDPDNVQQGVLHQLIRIAERYKLQAWSDLEKRLEAECGPTAPALSDPGIASSECLASALQPRPTRRALAQRIDDLRINNGLSVEKLAELAKVDKKTLIGISKGSRPYPRTLKRIADALGVTAKELKPEVQDPTAPS